jgi:hypothetical protein
MMNEKLVNNTEIRISKKRFDALMKYAESQITASGGIVERKNFAIGYKMGLLDLITPEE